MHSEFKAYHAGNIHLMPQYDKLNKDIIRDIQIVSKVLPFKVNNYVLDELINWDNIENDPIFNLTIPQKGMLKDEHYNEIKHLLDHGNEESLKLKVKEIRSALNPHPAGQIEHNTPIVNGEHLNGVQHKYRETVLFFPAKGQTCHSYCTFCFRWPQFTGMKDIKFASKEIELFLKYIEEHKEISDILFTGGDPMVMSAETLRMYIQPLFDDKYRHIQTIRIGTKSFTFRPQRYLSDPDTPELLRLFEEIVKKGKNLAIMAHFNHPAELQTESARNAVAAVRNCGVQIRTQSPLLRHINDTPEIWAELWRTQVNLNCIPYYMFIARDTGAQHYFSVPLVKAWDIFRNAYQRVSGVCRTVRGPSMSCNPGKVQILGTAEINQKKYISMRFIQGRNPDWAARPFFAEYDENAVWIDDLKPAFGEKQFFFEKELIEVFHEHINDGELDNFE